MAKLNSQQQERILKIEEVNEKEQYLKERKINRLYTQEKFLEKELSTAAIDPSDFVNPFDTFRQSFVNSYKLTLQREQKVLEAAVPFICEEFNSRFRLIPGQLMTVAAYTGAGKSTTTVNAAANYIRNGKRVYIISNEETANDFCNMIACVLTGISHQRMSNGILTPEERATLTTKVLELFHSKQLLVFDEENTNGGTSKAEYVLDQIRALHNSDYRPDVLFIDYLTNIYAAGSLTNGDHYFQLDRFLKNLKGLINQICFPVVMCAQMHSDDKKKGNSLDTKLIMGGVIQQVSTIAVEVRVNRENLTSEFRIHKNRRFKCYDPITLKYDNGALRSLKEHEHLDEFCHLVEKMEEADEK